MLSQEHAMIGVFERSGPFSQSASVEKGGVVTA